MEMENTTFDPIEKQPLQRTLENQIETAVVGKSIGINIGEKHLGIRRQQIMVMLGNIGIVSSGMGLALPTVIIDQLKDTREVPHFDDSQIAWIASINTLSCPLGGLLSFYILDRLGRKFSLYVLNVLSLIAWALMATAVESEIQIVYIQILTSRFITGVSMGLSSAPAGVYSAEISSPKIRGCLILGTSISIAVGILIMYVLGYFIRNDWHLLALICTGYQIISLFCLLPLRESPTWLVSKNRFKEAKRSLNFFRGLGNSCEITNSEVLTEYNNLMSTQQANRKQEESFWKLLCLPEVFKPLLILMSLFTFQQTSGIFVVVVYAVQIAQEARATIDPLLCAILIGLARVMTTIPLGAILEKWGRRRIGVISACGMSICMFLLSAESTYSWLQNIPYLSVICIVSFIVISTTGLYTLPFLLLSELFPQNVRGQASGLTVAFGMFLAFISIRTYPDMKNYLGSSYCFTIYGVCALLGAIFIYFLLPETKGRTLSEIEENFRRPKKELCI